MKPNKKSNQLLDLDKQENWSKWLNSHVHVLSESVIDEWKYKSIFEFIQNTNAELLAWIDEELLIMSSDEINKLKTKLLKITCELMDTEHCISLFDAIDKWNESPNLANKEQLRIEYMDIDTTSNIVHTSQEHIICKVGAKLGNEILENKHTSLLDFLNDIAIVTKRDSCNLNKKNETKELILNEIRKAIYSALKLRHGIDIEANNDKPNNNPLEQFVKSMDNQTLSRAAFDVLSMYYNGVLPDGPAMELRRNIAKLVGSNPSNLFEQLIMREASVRFIANVSNKTINPIKHK